MTLGRRMPLSLTARFALLFSLFAASLLLLVGMVIERAVVVHFDEFDRHDLAAKLVVIRNQLERTTSEGAHEALGQRLDDVLIAHESVAVLIHDAQGAEIYSIRPEVLAPARRHDGGRGEGVRYWELDGRQYIGREERFEIPLLPPREVRALVAIDISHHTHFLAEVRNRLWFGISIAALLAAGLGWLAAHKGLGPLRRVTATARRLSAKRLGERISESDAPAEMLELVEAFNGMLDRLEGAFRRLNDYSADIAHELRTPVSNLMTETEVALSRTRTADDYRETLHSNLEEFERLSRMISDMLFLAKADNGLLPRPAEVVALDLEARALADFYEALAEEKDVALRIAGAATVTGDRLMLRRALSNLVSNALRHTPSGGTIEILIGSEAGYAVLSVNNPGDAIAPEQLPLLFERFHRADPSRALQGEGAGLGLAITRSIVEAHGGHIAAASSDGTTRFTLYLPRAGKGAAASDDETYGLDTAQ